MENLRDINEIPPPYRNIFVEYPCFNAIQSQVLDDILYTDNSVVVSAPTGSGKTAIFELAIVRLLIQYENLDVSQKVKIVYICPIKALCHERLLDWHKKFSPFGLNCIAATGDSDNLDFEHLTNHNLIISTPEKWDSLTRRWRDHEKLVKVVKLFMIDEVHLLNEENRGSTLEVIVCRMKTVENCLCYSAEENDMFAQKVRFIALSATVPNVEDIAEWIGKPPHTKYYRFSEEMRPVKLKKIVYGYNYNPKTMSPFKFDISLNYKLPSLMMQYSEGKPTLIFCSTRKSVEMAANHIVHSLKIHLSEEQAQKLLDVAGNITDAKAKATVRHGVGYHHAGMIPETRHAIESLFRNGDLPVLVTTSTLAMGVNLPAHLVIVKSTKCYDNGGFRDYTETAIHQMVGRAGRPQFDTSATALILTTNEDKPKFEKMVSCGQPIESNLHRHLTEHLNAEIVLRTITDLDVAMQWLSSTFLYVRARKNPHHYGINVGYTQEQIDKKLLEMCQIDLNKLAKTGMITIDQNIVITPNIIGKIMAKYYVAFETMKLFTQVTGTEIMIQILALICKCQEFVPMRLRVNDKKTLNMLNKNPKKDTIRFPLNGRIKTWDMKVNCIIQAVLGNLDIHDHSILSDSLTIMRNGERVAKCLVEYLETRRTNGYSALFNAIVLGKCFHAKLWENSPYVTKQLTGIGSVMSTQLANVGKTTFRQILDSNPRDIELIIKRKSPMGSVLVEEVKHIPSYKMTLQKILEGKQLELCITLENVDDVTEKSTVNINSVMVLLVGDNSNEILVYEKYAHSYMIEHAEVKKILDVNTNCEIITAHFISEDWVGIDCNSSIELRDASGAKANKKTEIGKTTRKKSPTYVQKFLDTYMKKKKKATTEVSTKKKTAKEDLKSEVKAKVEEKNGETKPEVKSQKVVKNSEQHKDLVIVEKEKTKSQTKEVQEHEPELEDIFDMSNLSPFSIELVDEKIPKDTEIVVEENSEKIEDSKLIQTENESDEKSVKPDSLVDIEERVMEAPSLYFISKKYGMDNLPSSTSSETNKTKVNQVKRAVEFDSSFYKEDAKKQKFEEFKFPLRKKFTHKPEPEDLPDSTADSRRYVITEILGPSVQKHKNHADQNDSAYETEISFKERNKEKSITWRSPLVFSPKVKFSPKINLQSVQNPKQNIEKDVQNECNNTFDTSISSKSNTTHLTATVQGTPKHKSRGTLFPLKDRDYNETLTSEQDDDAFDICSSSFLEQFGFNQNQHKITPRLKKTQPSPTVNYYSQLVSTPIQVQKHKNQDKSQSTDDKNLKTKDGDKENRDTKHFRQSIPHTEVSGIKLETSQQIYPDSENIEHPTQEFKCFERQDPHNEFILAGNRPVSYLEVPQIDLNRSFQVSNTNTSRQRPTNFYTKQQSYPHQYVQQRFSDFDQIPDHHQGFIEDNYFSTRPRLNNEFVRCSDRFNYPKTPHSFHSNRNFPQTNFERFRFERKPSNLETDLNQSQIFDNDRDIEDFYHQRSYFENNPSRIDNFSYERRFERENSQNYGNFQRENLPQRNVRRILSQNENIPQKNQGNNLENFNRPNNFPLKKFPQTQTSSLTQRKSFEDQMNEENNMRDAESSFFLPIASQSAYDDQNFAQRPYRGDLRTSSFDTFNYDNFNPRNKPESYDRALNENLVKSLNRTLSFEDFSDENHNFGHNDSIYDFQTNQPGFPPRDWNMRGQNSAYRNRFDPQQGPSYNNRSFTAPRPYTERYFNPTNEEMGSFPPSNDKEYVLNKFLYSLNK